MGRKNLLSGLMEGLDVAGAEPPAAAEAVVSPLPRRPSTGAIGAVSRAIAEIRSRAETEIDPAIIHDDGFRDRLSIDEADVAELQESIRASGQRVPILVRPHPERPGEFRVVYGRRRLVALRALGRPAKALVQELSDEEAILAQGQENSARRDPSFIEKALFAQALEAADYAPSLIQDALAIDKTVLSRMRTVTEHVPEELILEIGAAPRSGRRRWEELALILKEFTPERPVALAFPQPLAPDSTSDQRLDIAIRNLSRAAQVDRGQLSRGSGGTEVKLRDGRRLGRMKVGQRSIDLRLLRKEAPDFTAWIERDPGGALARLYELWSKESGST